MSSMILPILFLLVCVASGCPTERTQNQVEEGPPQPYSFTYHAGRAPGHIDRTHSETKDESGVVIGSYSYVDPLNKVQRVEYVADELGIQIRASNLPQPPIDTPAVAAAKARHQQQYDAIVAEHARVAADHQRKALAHEKLERAIALAREYQIRSAQG